MAVVSLHSAASGLSALNTELDVIAHNLANVNTDGFKASRVNFQDLLYQEKALPGVENANGDERPTGVFVGLGVKVAGTQLDFSQGAPLATGRALDLYIDDDSSFFQVQVEDDRAEGGIAYTRFGAITTNSEGELVLANAEGRRLVPPIEVPVEATQIEVNNDGAVFVQIPGEAEPEEIGRLQLATFINPQGLAQLGENLFAETGASGPVQIGEPATESFGQIRSGFLEGSNVDPTFELISLIRTQRAFEMNSQTIRAADETLRSISQLRR
jgi:flagellar basal-body rod protein FlgG